MMEKFRPNLRQQLSQNRHALGAIAVKLGRNHSVNPEELDLLVVILTENRKFHQQISMYRINHWKVKEVWITLSEWSSELVKGERDVVECLMNGRILYDPYEKIQNQLNDLRTFPTELQQKMMCLEFSRLLQAHVESESYMKEANLLDAHSSVQKVLTHWARLAVVESGTYPRAHLWYQVKSINPGVYKLYRELVWGEESIDQRVHLVMLAVEYTILNRLEYYCSYLMELLASKEESWSINEIHEQLWIKEFHQDVTLIMEELVRRTLVELVMSGEEMKEQRYRWISGIRYEKNQKRC